MNLENIAKTNPYISSREKNVPPLFYTTTQIIFEICVPGYSIVNGIYWDSAIVNKNNI